MEENRLRQLIKSGKYAMGLGITIQDPTMVEIAAQAGFSWLHVRMGEHAVDMLRAADACQIPVIISVPGKNLDPTLIARALDLGADGMAIPLVSSRQEAENIVRLCRMPPMGEREVTPACRQGKYWGISMEEFTRQANEAVIYIRIETKEGLEHAEEILSVPGIGMVAVGMSDLSRHLGVKRDGPEIMAAEQRITKVANAAGVARQQIAMTAEELGEWVEREPSLRLFFLAPDSVQVSQLLRGLIQRCNENVAKFAKGPVEGLISRVHGPIAPWLTTQAGGKR